MPNSTYTQPDTTFDLAELLYFLWSKKFRIAFLTILIAMAGAYHIFSLPKIYTASSTILLGDGEQSFGLGGVVPNFGNDGDVKIDTYMEFIRSRQFIGQVVDKLDLIYDPEFRPQSLDVSPEYTRDHAINVLLNGLSLNRLGDTTLLKVTFNSKTPRIAAAVANEIGPAFFAFQSNMGKQKADETSQWLSQQLDALQTKLTTAEQTLQNFLVDNNLTDIRSQLDISKVEISGLLQERLAVEIKHAEVMAAVNQVALAGDNIQAQLQVPWISRNPMMISLRNAISNQQQAFAQLSKRYKSKHHKYVAAQTQLATLQAEQANLINELSAGLKQELDKLALRKKNVEQHIEAARKVHNELGRHEMQIDRLRREVDSTQTLYEEFLTRLRETEILKDLDNSEQFAVIDVASVPVGPSKPRVALLMALILMFGSLASSGFWLVLHIVSDKKTRFTTLLNKMQVPVLAQLPKHKKTKLKKGVVTANHKGKNFAYSESIRSLRAEISYRSDTPEMRILGIARVKNGKSKSSVGIDLAESFAQLEKSIVLDADMRTPSVGKCYDLDEKAPGLTNFIGRRCSFSDASYRENGSQLSVMPAGVIPSDPLLYISRSRFSSFIKKLGVLFEHVIIETPEVNLYSDTMIIAKAVDGLILLCDLEACDSADLQEAVQRLQESRAPLLGVVFENVKNVKNKMPGSHRSQGFINKVVNY
ncbi:GumC family protein [Paraglaciecola aestuariivivens]